MKNVVIVDHPIVKQKLGILRNKETQSNEFRRVMKNLSRLITYEATRELELRDVEVSTPLAKTKISTLKNLPIIVSIMRAGNGMLESVMELLPGASVGHIGIYRDKFINNTVEYYFRLPNKTSGKKIFLLDPMVATGDTAAASISRLKECGVKSITFLTVLISELAVKRLHQLHPDVTIYCANVEKELNESGQLLPGMGDAGSRLYFNE